MMDSRYLAGGIALSVLVAGLAAQVAAQKAVGPKARYQMDVTTASGMPGMAGMGGGGVQPGARPRGGGLGAMFGGGGMSAMMGGGGPRRELELRLGSTLAPSGVPTADHFVPAGLGLGPSVPLVTPTVAPTTPERGDVPRDFQRPKGRMLIFWGCGAKAGPGQPVVIDFARMAAGQIPPGLFSANVPVDRGVMQGNSRTYGYWPNDRGRRVELPGNATLVGAHRVAGNYSPEIKFALNQDFMAPMRVQTTDMGQSTNISWNAIPAATGYYAHGMGFSGGGKRGGSNDIVWWTSASRQEFFGGLTDWLAPAVVQRLIGERVVMPPTQTQCQIPAEVKAAGGEMMMLSMYAYGPEASFAFPPRPANPKLAWNPEWTARVRYRSVSNKIVGMPDMDEAMSGEDGRSEPRQPAKKCGMLQRAAGLC